MASFVGTEKDFIRYIGPRLRNLVNQITRPYKLDVAKCEHCGLQKGPFDAAHKHGYERPKLIKKVLSDFTFDSTVTINLDVFEGKFKELHYPIDEVILVLCRACHRKYDEHVPVVGLDEKTVASTAIIDNGNDDILEIELVADDAAVFRKKLLEKKQAVISIFYQNGDVVDKKWNAARFKSTSSVLGNLRSRPEFRQGNWQKYGIKKVSVRVD